MVQQGQVFKLKTKGADSKPLWAYRYRLQGMALQELRRLPANPKTPLVFPNARGGYIDLHNFRQRQWRPALVQAGIEPLRQPYDLRHTYATFALRAGLSAFALSR